jgi:hypothetical protein
MGSTRRLAEQMIDITNEPPRLFDGKHFTPLHPDVIATLSDDLLMLYGGVADACERYENIVAQLDAAKVRVADAANVIVESNAILNEAFPKPTRLDLVRDVIASGRQ